jgi:hypothetical protein
MEDLLEALNTNGFARVDATLEDVIGNTAQDAQYSPGAHANLAVLRKYELEMGDWRVGEIKHYIDLKKKLAAAGPQDSNIPKGATVEIDPETGKVVPSKYY